ncbi:alpha/beta fold hydrolase [Consotaella aegiceratis]|uniref:alpha/beta fold hydrolase n=1 Tax=Consotaella aegiceratis TaxID=3097961 RepID=UPI002F421A65
MKTAECRISSAERHSSLGLNRCPMRETIASRRYPRDRRFPMHRGGTTIAIDGVRLYVQQCGDPWGRPVLFLHGGAGSLDDWDPLIERFSHYRCILLDSRGHGASTRTQQPLSYPRLASDTEAVIAALEPKRPIIVGHSDGGITGIHVAARDRIELAGLITIAAHGDAPGEEIMREIYQPLTAALWRARFPEMVAAYERLNPNADFDAFFEWLVAMWRDTSAGNYPGERTDDIRCPALVIGGDADHLVPREETVALAGRIDGAALGLVPMGSHVPHWDCPDFVGGWIEGFIEGLAPG